MVIHVQCLLLPRVRRKRCCVLCACLLAGICTIFLFYLRGSEMCSEDESVQFISDLCEAVQNGRVVGKLCTDICSKNGMNFVRCLNYRHGKVILQMDWNGKPLVLKTQEIEVAASKTLEYVLGGDYYPSFEIFSKLVLTQLSPLISKAYQGNPNELSGSKRKNLKKENILAEMMLMPVHVNDEASKLFDKKRKRAIMNSIWSVVQQNEFAFLKINDNWKFMPQIYGTCGKFYAMEFVQSGSVLESDLFGWGVVSDRQRVEMALQFLEMVRQMEGWNPEPLHMCDVKLENFGWSSQGLQIIDVDMFFFNSQMEGEIMSPMNCSTHQDCDFFDCRGWCQATSGKCLSKRTNNNLQSVCSKIFMDSIANGFKGLFHSLPRQIRQRMDRLLQECGHPLRSPDPSVPGKATLAIGEEMRQLLEEGRNILLNVM